MKKLALGLVLLVGLAGAVGLAAWVIDLRVRSPYRGYLEPERFVEIPTGASTRAIGDELAAAGVVRDAITFRAALWLTGQARHLKAGEYRFDQAMTPGDVIAKIARGDVYVVPVTFPEGLTMAEMARIAERHGFGPAAAFIEAARDPEPVRAFDPAARDLEGYLFPDTYPLPRRTTARALVRMMVERFDKAFTTALREAAGARHLSVRAPVHSGKRAQLMNFPCRESLYTILLPHTGHLNSAGAAPRSVSLPSSLSFSFTSLRNGV